MVFEHPGLLEPEPACTDEVCITCSDEGRVGEVRPCIGDGRAEVLVGGTAARRSTSAWSTPWRPATCSWSTPGWPSTDVEWRPAAVSQPSRPASSTPSSRPRSGTPTACSSDLAASARAKMARAGRCAPPRSSSCAEALVERAAAMADGFGRGGRLFAFGNGGSATDAEGTVALFREPAVRAAAAGHVAGRRPGRAHRPGQRRRLRPGLLPAAHRPRPRRRHRGRVLHQRRLGQRAPGPRGGVAAGAAHDRAVRLRGRRHGASDAVDHCLVVRSDSVHRIQEAQDA